ncbi:unnamed protein product [Brachionus calyciflorus]|uniref:Heme-binding protein 2 n=1 Tax=Brachionus calyciflorus TaxID=104777 RepID=A0A814FUD1_9BILA|nr:unnamed protein product [Brachionus calyciflorus]
MNSKIFFCFSVLALIKLIVAIEKPEYELVSSMDDLTETRRYSPSKWVSTSTVTLCSNLDSQRNVLFSRLFAYIAGQNDKNQQIKMTAPVLNEIKQLDEQNCLFTMRFYIPKENQVNTPIPSGNAVLTDLPETTFTVTKFGGYATMNDFNRHSNLLKQRLGSQLSLYDVQTMVTAGYNSPYELNDRTNEVWLRKL